MYFQIQGDLHSPLPFFFKRKFRKFITFLSKICILITPYKELFVNQYTYLSGYSVSHCILFSGFPERGCRSPHAASTVVWCSHCPDSAPVLSWMQVYCRTGTFELEPRKVRVHIDWSNWCLSGFKKGKILDQLPVLQPKLFIINQKILEIQLGKSQYSNFGILSWTVH